MRSNGFACCGYTVGLISAALCSSLGRDIVALGEVCSHISCSAEAPCSNSESSYSYWLHGFPTLLNQYAATGRLARGECRNVHATGRLWWAPHHT